MAGSMLSDGALVRLAKAGDAPAFEQLIERHAGLVYTIARARLRDSETAEDLMQEVFLRVHLNLHRLDDPERLAPWMASLARNLATDWLRRGQRRSQLLPLVSLDESTHHLPDTRTEGARETMASEQQREAVLAAIDRLPPDQREVVMLHWVEEMKQADIARHLGVRPNYVHRLLNRAMASMRDVVAPVLREAAPSLRVPRQAVARTSMVVGAAALLTGGAREALAAAAAASMPASSLTQAQAGAVGVVAAAAAAKSALLGFFQSTGAAIASGGTLMGLGKGAAVAAVIAAGGYFGYDKFIASESHTPASAVIVEESFHPAPQPSLGARPASFELAHEIPDGFAYDSEIQMRLSQIITSNFIPAPGVSVDIGMALVTQTRVTDKMPDGSARLEAASGDVQLLSASATQGGVTTDLLQQDQLGLRQTLQAQVNRAYTFEIDRLGNVTETVLHDVSEGNSGDEMIRQSILCALSGFPEHPVRVGDSWQRTLAIPVAPGSQISVTSTLEHVEDRGGQPVGVIRREAQIAFTGSIPMGAQTGMPPGMQLTLTSLSGQLASTGAQWLNTGEPISDEILADLTLTLAAGNVPTPQGPRPMEMRIRQRQEMAVTHQRATVGEGNTEAIAAVQP